MRKAQPPPNLGAFLTVGRAAAYLGVTPWTLRRWDRCGKLSPARHPLNGYRLYRREELDELLSRVHAGGAKQRRLVREGCVGQ